MSEIIVIGSGTFEPELNRHCASYLVKIGKEKIVFDLGRGAIDGLLKSNVNLFDIDRIFISHFHADHLCEIGAFLQWILYENNMKKMDYKLTIFGPVGLKVSIDHLTKAYNFYKHKYDHRFEVKELKDEEIIKFGNFNVQAFSVDHAVNEDKLNALSYRLENNKNIFCYSGDSPDCKGLRKACNNADLAIMEATLPERWHVKSHLTGEQLGKIAKEENIKKLVATHVSPQYLKDVEKDIRKYYKGKLLIARDLMRLKI